ncbi:MAG TPA: hypothetical protein VMU95_33715 [Trebonia sp.]|nr:hypothetical protein [Trebonia sp.]
MEHDALTDFPRITLDRLKLATDVILSEGEDIGDALTAELTLFKERVERALLLPARPNLSRAAER